MDEREKDQKEKGEQDIEDLLKERARIDELLKSRYSRDVTIMFSDIKGSTAFFESRGDIEGRVMIQKHNEMLFPLIERHQGRIIKTIGDAIMSFFEEPMNAIKSAIEIQGALFEYNQGKKELDQIQVRIGISTGVGLVEPKDVFGEVVIVAKRLESIAQAGQILISKPLYGRMNSSDKVICQYVGPKKLKGRTEALEVYQIVWREKENGEEECLTAPPSWTTEQRLNLGRGDTFKKGKDLLRLVNIVIFVIIIAGALSRIGFGIWKGSQDKSLKYRSSSETYTSQGMVMERAGKLDEAISYYEKALKENPDDSFASVFLKEVKRKAEIAQDKERQERINALVNDLLKASREKSVKAKEADTWTSRPLTITFLGLERKGGLGPLREGMDEYILLRLTSSLQAEGRIKVVEREILDKLLEELNLSTTRLIDEESALKVGRILAARLIGIGSISQLGQKSLLTLKFIETETTKIIMAILEGIDNPKDLDTLIEKVSKEATLRIKKEYPLRGKITSIEGDRLTINIGSDEGMKKGLKMRILSNTISMREGDIGLIEVTSGTPSHSQAKVIKKARGLVAGSRVEELIEG